MELFEKLQDRLTDLLDRYERLEMARTALERECNDLRAEVEALQDRVRKLTDENTRLARTLDANSDMAIKRIAKIVDKIDQFQGELKIS